MRRISIFLALSLLFISTGCDQINDRTFKIAFDSNEKISGQKFALSEISPELPSDWSDYNYVVLELNASTSQRFQVGFTTDHGYNELRVMSYVPGGWNKLAIPLRFFTQLPDAANDIAGTMNQPRYTGWINLGGKRGPLTGVDSIGIRMQVPLGNPVIELRSISLSVEDPGDQYLGEIPVVDEFGQSNLVDFENKVLSLDQLQAEWAAEKESLATIPPVQYSEFGGYLDHQVESTGFFRTEKINDKWWFVDPEGYLMLSLGVDCIGPGRGGEVNRLDHRQNFCKVMPPEGKGLNVDQPNRVSFGTWNLNRRFGDDYQQSANDMVISRMENWGLNTIANWSSRAVIDMNKKAFMLQLYNLGIDEGVMGLADVYVDDFAERIDQACREFAEPVRDNPWLIGYFTGNEPSWLGQESRLCDLILAESDNMPLRQALVSHLANGDTPDSRKNFILNTFKIFLETVNTSLKKHDPNHLSLGIRFGHIPEDAVLEICKEVFDVFSFNCYELYPPTEIMDRVLEVTGLPMVIGEYHFGTVNRGMAQALVQVADQKERGVGYRYYTEHAFDHPGLIGVGYFQWSDQDLTGRSYDGENYNCGLIDVTDRPYPHMVEAIKKTAARLYEIHDGQTTPFDQVPEGLSGYGLLPDDFNGETTL